MLTWTSVVQYDRYLGCDGIQLGELSAQNVQEQDVLCESCEHSLSPLVL